uniref:Uncharacterized protein n=1 Tax=Anguilla anguilla TaxID=7936 RepID=A0A0E9QED0_ANGAN
MGVPCSRRSQNGHIPSGCPCKTGKLFLTPLRLSSFLKVVSFPGSSAPRKP